MKKTKLEIKDSKEILTNLFIKERLNWFVNKMKKLEFYTERWEEAYELYLNTRLQDDDENIEGEFLKRDIGITLNTLLEFLIWQDENFADKDTERFLYFNEEEN
ncbi:hypothetical protein [Fusobacterium ulcerans]|uniref:hypothetical protein n=1 Tax=Fusobacterium ulcerans TaxID=861 RepID=UPI00309C90B3